MSQLDYHACHAFLTEHVLEPFYARRLEKLTQMRLGDVLQRKNPYLFKAKNLELPTDLIRSIVDAFLSSQEETLFGNLLETFAIYVSSTLYGGKKSTFKSVDLEFLREDVYYLVGIKSGVNWGNADQVSQMRSSFKAAKEVLRPIITVPIVAVNGCIYGHEVQPFKKSTVDPDKNYYKLAGQDFWYFLSLDDQLYREIIKPIHTLAGERDQVFRRAYVGKINEMTMEFQAQFMVDNFIDWEKLLDFVSKRRTATPPTIAE